MLLMVSGPAPLLVSVTGRGLLVTKYACSPKSRLVGESVTVGPKPVPVRATVCGLPGASSAMLIVPFLVPPAVGVKVTLMVQEPPTATGLTQLWFWAKSPLGVMLRMVSAPAPLLVSVTVFGALGTPTPRLPKVKLVGDKVTAGPKPLPVRVTLCGLPAALSVTVNVPDLVPDAVGAKVTLMVQ
jgi:hypothetical protein